MSTLYNDLALLDRKMADRWKTRSRDDVRHVLSAADVDFILADVIRSARTTDITEKQGSAIIMMLNASLAANAAKSGAALDRITYYVDIWQAALRLNMQPFTKTEDLLPIANFLGNGVVSRVVFKSPGTNISYAPFDYIAVGQLILNGDVLVFMSKTGGLSSLSSISGEYYHEENLFMIYNMDPRARRLNFVHEGTHIIQDWEDVASFAHHNEADAFIAQAVAELALYSDAPDTDEVTVKAREAAKMVIDKTAVDSNAKWQAAYKAVVQAVGRVYKKYGVFVDHAEKGGGPTERSRFTELLREITIANNIRDVAVDKIAQTLNKVLP
jgi:hypothetical protein